MGDHLYTVHIIGVKHGILDTDVTEGEMNVAAASAEEAEESALDYVRKVFLKYKWTAKARLVSARR